LDLAGDAAYSFAGVDALGTLSEGKGFFARHIDAVLAHPMVQPSAVRNAAFRVVLDAVNSTGSLILPELLARLGCEVIVLNGTPDGHFAHNPEPLPEHLKDLSEAVVAHQAHLGVAVDPDVDRLALIAENGLPFGEEYTLVAIADYILRSRPGNTVSNLSSSRALRDVTIKHGGQYFASAVGEVHVAAKMREVGAVIGGEGNGGIIVPELHYGRDAVAGLALFLSALSAFGGSASAFRAQFPQYEMVKDKIDLDPSLDLDRLMGQLEQSYQEETHSTLDGLKVDFESGWVHLRRSNTEPIIRIYAEAPSMEEASALAGKIKNQVKNFAAR
jgi:phosphomannomutase